MQKSSSIYWKSLYNALYLLSLDNNETLSLSKLDPLVFDGLAIEIEDSFDLGFCGDAFYLYENEKWLTKNEILELQKFKFHTLNIAPEYWNDNDILHSKEWEIARNWAVSLFSKIGFNRNGFDFSLLNIIFVE